MDYGLEAAVEAENRFSAQGRLYRHYEVTPELIWHYSPRYDFSLGYEESGTYHHEDLEQGHQGYLTTTLKLDVKEWRFGSRQRLQAGTDNGATVWIFRQKNRVAYAGVFLPFDLVPFLADEWFCDLQGGGITENRVQLGLSRALNEKSKIELYGMWVDQWMPHHSSTPVFGLNFTLNF